MRMSKYSAIELATLANNSFCGKYWVGT